MVFRLRAFLCLCAVFLVGAAAVTSAVRLWNDTKNVTLARQREELAERVRVCPKQSGDWVSADASLDSSEIDNMHLAAYSRRLFTNETTGATVLVYVVVGTPRYVTIHCPDFSYRYGSFSFVDGPTSKEIAIGGRNASVSVSSLVKKTVDMPESLLIVRSYSADGV